MSDCADTVYYPLESYVGLADLCGECKGIDLQVSYINDPEADPPVVDEPVYSDDAALFLTKALYASPSVHRDRRPIPRLHHHDVGGRVPNYLAMLRTCKPDGLRLRWRLRRAARRCDPFDRLGVSRR